MVGKFFTYKAEYDNTPFISKIRILTTSDIDSATFNLRLYLPDAEGKPGSYLYDNNILCRAKKGKRITEVDVSELDIVFPETGFFIAFEWLVLEQNKYEYKHSIKGQPGRYDGVSYEPNIGSLSVDNAANHWVFTHGAWYVREGYKYDNSVLAIELILSN